MTHLGTKLGRITGRRFVALLALVLSALVIPHSPTAFAQAARTIRVVTAKGQPYYISSYFLNAVAPPGIKFDLVDAPTSGEALDSLLTGGSDVAYLGLITSILAVARDRPIVVAAAVGYKGTRIVARANGSVRSLADLRGKNIGVSRSTTQDIIMRELLVGAGLDPAKDVNWILLPTNAHFEAMATGTVDAVTTSEPYGSFLILKGIGRELVADPYQTPVSGVATVLAFSRDGVAKDPGLVQTIVDLHAKATVYVHDHPDEAVKALMIQSRQTEAVMKMAMSNAALHYDIGDAYLTQTRTLVDELIKAKYLDRTVSTDKLFDLRFLPGARSAAGRIH